MQEDRNKWREEERNNTMKEKGGEQEKKRRGRTYIRDFKKRRKGEGGR